ncbi:ABC transporter permease [Alkalinema sp. FACHB-956]|uniref:ABC transporter permease n=1 Tax=Alkalinema sp. FACHB-956 TaxID=2692768 RepID=UPI00168932F5|nr:ABC transporter permease [Alkalinema sp. FACHB-956]MBD2326223.1 ABC transporter permease [Alkalinema sp. FACHB-956]
MSQSILSPVTPPTPSQPATSSPATLGDFAQETLALTRRLFIQLKRRPSTLVAGVVQPLMWLILFGALFQNAPQDFLGNSLAYGQFLGAGVIVFTAFSGALNSGLPVMFDREFGFLNRLLVAPLASRLSIVGASALFIMAMSLIQTVAIIVVSGFLGAGFPTLSGLGLMLLILALLVVAVTALSLGLAFALPGHIELIAVLLVVNLPLLFASTALAPLAFMPTWLQAIAAANPLSYAIEPIRHLYLQPQWHWSDIVMQAPWGDVSLWVCVAGLLGFATVSIVAIQPLLKRSLG